MRVVKSVVSRSTKRSLFINAVADADCSKIMHGSKTCPEHSCNNLDSVHVM